VVRVDRVVRRVDCLVAAVVVVEDRRRLVVVVRRVEGAREDTVEVDFVVMAVMTLVSLSFSSEDSSGGGDGIIFRRRLGEDWTGLETGTAAAERRVPTRDVRVTRGISHRQKKAVVSCRLLLRGGGLGQRTVRVFDAQLAARFVYSLQNKGLRLTRQRQALESWKGPCASASPKCLHSGSTENPLESLVLPCEHALKA
jgi:hypothetical protein